MSTTTLPPPDKRFQEAINAYAKSNLNYQLCKQFLLSLCASDLIDRTVKVQIKEFLESIKDK